jgi:uncharacterized protein YceK
MAAHSLQLALKIVLLAIITSLSTDLIPKSRQDGAQKMIRHALMAALMLGFLGSLPGCGTMANLGPPDPKDADAPRPGRIFGGVERDAAWARKHFETPTSATNQEPSLSDQLKGSYFLCVDMPCSFVADTLTLPLTFLIAIGEEEDSLMARDRKNLPGGG